MKASFDMPEARYVVDYGAKVKQAEGLLSYLASCDSTYIYLTNPGDEPIPIRPGCKLTFMQLGAVAEGELVHEG